ncbi:MAG: BMC domain-containing protein [Actinobacteria bacterium]|nr:BMC domain-containing protein [Actinomycetota bacterium]
MAGYKGNIAIVEFKSISRGLIVTDAMLKTATVSLVLGTTLCPGKYLTIVEGDVAAVEKAQDTADRLGGRQVFSSFVVSGINNEVIGSISGNSAKLLLDSIGIIESLQMANLIKAADISLDSAEVEIVELRLGKGCGVNSFYIITGDLASINEACENAASFLSERGALIAFRVIANPDKNLLRWLGSSMCNC